MKANARLATAKPSIDATPPGTLAQVVKAVRAAPDRTKALWVTGALGIASVGAIAVALFIPPASRQVSIDRQAELYDFIGADPALLAGVSTDDTPAEALAKIHGVMPQFDAALARQLDDDMAALIQGEALRLTAEAQKEADSGAVDWVDPVADIDLQACSAQIETWRCILLRYAGDGIAAYQLAATNGDVNAAMLALIRVRASLLAMGPVKEESPRIQASLKMTANYRLAIYDLARLLPESMGPDILLQVPLGDLSPAENLEGE